MARENGIVILTFPPHCSHRLRPLDVGVYSPFKTRYRIAMNEWMLTNAGTTVTIYHIAQFVNNAYLAAFSPHNITQGFYKTGIYPLNSCIFKEDDFLPSFVTDRPDDSAENADLPQAIASTSSQNNAEKADNENMNFGETADRIPLAEPLNLQSASTNSNDNPVASTSKECVMISPEIVRPFPKAGPRKQVKKSCRKMRSAIITDTPEKDRIEEIELNKRKKNKTILQKMKTKKSIKSLRVSSDSSESDGPMSLHDDSNDSLCDLTSNTNISKKCYLFATTEK